MVTIHMKVNYNSFSVNLFDSLSSFIPADSLIVIHVKIDKIDKKKKKKKEEKNKMIKFKKTKSV